MPTCPTIFSFPESQGVPAAPLNDVSSAGRNDLHSQIAPGNTISSRVYYKLLGLGSTEKAAQNFDIEDLVHKRTTGMLMLGPWI